MALTIIIFTILLLIISRCQEVSDSMYRVYIICSTCNENFCFVPELPVQIDIR